MKPDDPSRPWSYVVFVVMLAIDMLMLSRATHLLSLGPGQIPAEAPVLLGFILLLQVLVLWLYGRLQRSLTYHRTLKESYEQELDMTRQVMESVGHGLALMDERRQFVYVNAALAQFVGQCPQAMRGHSPLQYVHPEDHAEAIRRLNARWTGETSTYALRVKRADGQMIPVQVTGTPRWVHGRIVGNFVSLTALG